MRAVSCARRAAAGGGGEKEELPMKWCDASAYARGLADVRSEGAAPLGNTIWFSPA
jgi:hypothetical protein